MELYLFRRADYDLLYNCSFYIVDSIPVSSRQHPIIGSIMLTLVSIYVVSCLSEFANFGRYLLPNNRLSLADIRALPVDHRAQYGETCVQDHVRDRNARRDHANLRDSCLRSASDPWRRILQQPHVHLRCRML